MFDDLLAPISDEAPSGEYLKDNRSLFRGYRNEFNMAQSSFRQLVEVPDAVEDAELVDANSTNWNKLSESCHLCLATKSKDLEIFSWFTVAQLFTAEPFKNLSAALISMEAVVENFWSTLHLRYRRKSVRVRQSKSKPSRSSNIVSSRYYNLSAILLRVAYFICHSKCCLWLEKSTLVAFTRRKKTEVCLI